MASSVRVVNAVVLLLATVMISCVEAVDITGFLSSPRCRSGMTLQCRNIQSIECCDFIANPTVQSTLFETIGTSRWMSVYTPFPNAPNGCGNLVMKRRNLHDSPKTHRCLIRPGTSGARWHPTEPSLFGTSSGSPTNTTCAKTHKAVLAVWNSTLNDYVEVH